MPEAFLSICSQPKSVVDAVWWLVFNAVMTDTVVLNVGDEGTGNRDLQALSPAAHGTRVLLFAVYRPGLVATHTGPHLQERAGV